MREKMKHLFVEVGNQFRPLPTWNEIIKKNKGGKK
jgi:hypothetical protein